MEYGVNGNEWACHMLLQDFGYEDVSDSYGPRSGSFHEDGRMQVGNGFVGFGLKGAARSVVTAVGRALDGARLPFTKELEFDVVRDRLVDVIGVDDALNEVRRIAADPQTYDDPDSNEIGESKMRMVEWRIDRALGEDAARAHEAEPRQGLNAIASRCHGMRDMCAARAMRESGELVATMGSGRDVQAMASMLMCEADAFDASAERAFESLRFVGLETDDLEFMMAAEHLSDIDLVKSQSRLVTEAGLLSHGGVVSEAFLESVSDEASARSLSEDSADGLAKLRELASDVAYFSDAVRDVHYLGEMGLEHARNLVFAGGRLSDDLSFIFDANVEPVASYAGLPGANGGMRWVGKHGFDVIDFAEVASRVDTAEQCCDYVEEVSSDVSLQERSARIRELCDTVVGAVCDGIESGRSGDYMHPLMVESSRALSGAMDSRDADGVERLRERLCDGIESGFVGYEVDVPQIKAPTYDGKEVGHEQGKGDRSL